MLISEIIVDWPMELVFWRIFAIILCRKFKNKNYGQDF